MAQRKKAASRPAKKVTRRASPAAATAPKPAPKPAPKVDAEAFAIEIARLAHDDKCHDITVLDVRGLNPVADFVIIASGTSDRQMRAAATHVEHLGEQLGHMPFRSSKDARATWLLVDFVDVVFHVFEPNTRAHYDLEMMWGDAPRLAWERPKNARPPGAKASTTTSNGAKKTTRSAKPKAKPKD